VTPSACAAALRFETRLATPRAVRAMCIKSDPFLCKGNGSS
jgi:hypothetical protein